MASVSGSISSYDLVVAFDNVKQVCALVKRGQPAYLDANFMPTVAEGEKARDPKDLIDRVKILTDASKASDKFKKANSILIYLSLLYKDSVGIHELVKHARENLAKAETAATLAETEFMAKTQEMWNELDDLQTLKNFFDSAKKLIQACYSHYPVAAFLQQNVSADNRTCMQEGIEYLQQIFEGIAVLIAMPLEYDPVRREYTLHHQNLRKETIDFLTMIIQSRSLPPEHALCKMQQQLYVILACQDFKKAIAEFRMYPPIMTKKYTETEWRPFYQCVISMSEALPLVELQKVEDFYKHFTNAHECLELLAQNSGIYKRRFQEIYERIDKMRDSSVSFHSMRPDHFARDAFILTDMDRTPPAFLAAKVSTAPSPSAKAKKKKKRRQKVATPQSITSAAAPNVEKKESKEPVARSSPAIPASFKVDDAKRSPRSVVQHSTDTIASPAVASSARVRRMPALVPNESSPFFNLKYNNNSVHAWFEKVEAVLASPKYNHLSVSEKTIQVRRHTFTFDVDRFLCSHHGADYIHESERTSRNHKLFSVVAQMQNGSEVIDGILTFCVDENGMCYHRYFGPKANENFFDMVMKDEIRADHEFPSLSKSSEVLGKPAQYRGTLAHETIDIDAMGIATIPNGEGVIRLLKIPHHLRAKFNRVLAASTLPEKETK